MSAQNRFNIRVYAIIINENDEVLFSDERRNGHSFTKFPGGGLEFGEGTKECLERELMEELHLDSIIGDLFYVNDSYQESAFRKTDQLISFYYLLNEIDFEAIVCKVHPIPMTEEGEAFRWVNCSDISPELFTFPIDKVVAKLLRQS